MDDQNLPLEARLTSAQREEVDELATICPTAVFRKKGKLEVGCKACPNNSEPPEDRKPVEARREDDRISPYARLRGAFTRPGADERLLVMDSCSCAGCFEDAFLLRPGARGVLEVAARTQVAGSNGCKLVRRRGQVDRALCTSDIARQGYHATTLKLYDFRRTSPKSEAAPAFKFSAVDNTMLACIPGGRFISRSIKTWELRDPDGDGEEELRVELLVDDGTVTQTMAQSDCQTEPGAAPGGKRVELLWSAAPNGFNPTAETAAELARLDKAARAAGVR